MPPSRIQKFNKWWRHGKKLSLFSSNNNTVNRWLLTFTKNDQNLETLRAPLVGRDLNTLRTLYATFCCICVKSSVFGSIFSYKLLSKSGSQSSKFLILSRSSKILQFSAASRDSGRLLTIILLADIICPQFPEKSAHLWWYSLTISLNEFIVEMRHFSEFDMCPNIYLSLGRCPNSASVPPDFLSRSIASGAREGEGDVQRSRGWIAHNAIVRRKGARARVIR